LIVTTDISLIPSASGSRSNHRATECGRGKPFRQAAAGIRPDSDISLFACGHALRPQAIGERVASISMPESIIPTVKVIASSLAIVFLLVQNA
jgi:hypothetical protein